MTNDFEAEFAAALQESHDAFMGAHKDSLEALSGFSRAEIDAITPGELDLIAYDQLMTVVKKASAQNMDSAQLATRIRSLGTVAVSIAKKVPSLAAIL